MKKKAIKLCNEHELMDEPSTEETSVQSIGDTGRDFLIKDEIDSDLIDTLGVEILLLNDADADIPINERVPIRLFINSVGGESTTAMLFAEIIEKSETPIIGIALTRVWSAACLIYLACHHRTAYKYSTFLWHSGSLCINAEHKAAKNMYDFYVTQFSEEIKTYVLDNTKLNEEEYENLNSKESYMFGAEAHKMGFVDSIIERKDR